MRARALKMLHYYTTHGTGHTAKQAAHAISNTRAPASSALRLPLLAPLALLALLFLPARAARAEAATAAAGPAMLYQPGRQAQAEHCCLVTDFDGLCSDHESSSTVSVVSAEFLRSGSRVLKAQQR